MADEDAIFLDHTILTTHESCKEQSRLAYEENLRRTGTSAPTDFGTAFHAGVAALRETGDVILAEKAFIESAKGSELPITMDDNKRSIERGIVLLQAYAEKWKDSPYEVYKNPDGKPYVEIGFRLYMMEWKGRPLFICGLIDGVLVNKYDSSLMGGELKTTTTSLKQFMNQCKPNHQITLYDMALTQILGRKPLGFLWDAVYVSSRQPNPKGKDKWARVGVDIESDFDRRMTTRTENDHMEVWWDLRQMAISYMTWKDSNAARWPRNTKQCSNYGGCHYRDVCLSNNDVTVKANFYELHKWEPWKVRGASE